LFKSNGDSLWFFKFIPNVVSNQHLEKPTNPNTLAKKNKTIVSTGVNSNKPQNI
jgi:hypothetical protein